MTRSFASMTPAQGAFNLRAILALILTSIMLAAGWLLPTSAHAQTVLPGVKVSSPTTYTPPAPIGLSVTGWQQSASIGQGQNAGGDGKGTVQTVADGFFRIGAESYLTGNANPGCVVDCSNTQAKLWISGEQITGARATNQGVGNAPVSSTAGTNGMFNASLQTRWVFTPPPATAGN